MLSSGPAAETRELREKKGMVGKRVETGWGEVEAATGKEAAGGR